MQHWKLELDVMIVKQDAKNAQKKLAIAMYVMTASSFMITSVIHNVQN